MSKHSIKLSTKRFTLRLSNVEARIFTAANKFRGKLARRHAEQERSGKHPENKRVERDFGMVIDFISKITCVVRRNKNFFVDAE